MRKHAPVKCLDQTNKKARHIVTELSCHINGLVRIGKKFPYTILKRIFTQKKNFLLFFMHILICPVDNPALFSARFARKKYLFMR